AMRKLAKRGKIGRAAHDVVVGPFGLDAPDGGVFPEDSCNALIRDRRAHRHLEGNRACLLGRVNRPEDHRWSVVLPTPGFRMTVQLPDRRRDFVAEQAPEFNEQRHRRQREDGEMLYILPLDPAPDLLLERALEIVSLEG